MPDRFPITSVEIGFNRRVQLAAEIVDGVTLAPVRNGIKVFAEGLRGKPVVNRSGFFVWLEEPGRQAQAIVVDAARTTYSGARVEPLLPPDHRRIELAPTPAYVFPAGATGYRGTLIESRYGPRKPVAGTQVRLQWSDGVAWIDAPLRSETNSKGDFATALRLTPKAEPRADSAGTLAVRLRFLREGTVRTSDEFALAQGRVGAAAGPFIWDELNP